MQDEPIKQPPINHEKSSQNGPIIQSPQPTQVILKSKPNPIAWLGLGFALVLLLFGVWVLWQNYSKPAEEAVLNPSIEPVILDETADWETYTNSQFGFTLKYPPEAILGSRPPDPFPVTAQLQYIDNEPQEGGGIENPGWLIIISEPQSNPDNLSLREWAEANKLTTTNENLGVVILPPISDTVIADREAITWQSPLFNSQTYYLVNNPSGVIFIVVNINSPKAQLHQQTVNQILSTFKFIDKSTNESDYIKKGSEGNLAFTNPVYNYSFEYPETWTLINQEIHGGTVFLNLPGDVTFTPPGEDIRSPFSPAIHVTTMDDEKIRYGLDSVEKYNEWLTKPVDTNKKQKEYKIGETSVDGIPAVQFVYQTISDQTDPYYSVVTLFVKDNKRYYVENGLNETSVKQNMPIYNKILSTFKFTD